MSTTVNKKHIAFCFICLYMLCSIVSRTGIFRTQSTRHYATESISS